MTDKLLPCPFCGCTNVFTSLGFNHMKIECHDCGATPKDGFGTILYKKGECPDELKGVETYEAKCLNIKDKEGNIIRWPEHGYVGVNAMLAFKA